MPRVAKAKPKDGGGGGVKKVSAKKKNGYVMPEPIPPGEILTDLSKHQWKIGPSIGTGGFGEIYSASKVGSPSKKAQDNEFVVKIEPHGNGPLFVEMHFYMRNARLEDINKFMKSRGLKSLGMPHLIGSGSHDIKGEKHRFIVMPRYGKDIWSHFLLNGKKLPEHTIYRLCLQMLDVYEYIHGSTYVHADLKGANILLGFGKRGNSQAYLVDFGLASHYTTKDFKPDPKKMHNGTIEYTSRDAHNGVPTMRGDFEILAYNIIHWSGVTLPWEKDKLLTNPAKVQKSKEDFMSNVELGLKSLYTKNIPEPIKQYLKYVATLKYNDTPDYEKCRNIFVSGLKALGKSNVGDLDFKLGKVSKDTKKRYASESGDDEDIFQEEKKIPSPKKNIRDDKRNQPELKKDSPLKRPRTSSKESPKKSPKTSKSTPIRAKMNFSPAISISRTAGGSSSNRKQGKTVINDNLTPTTSSNKTYEFNFELDVSMDANVIVNVKRKKKAKDEESSCSSETPVPTVRIRKLRSSPRECTSPRSRNPK